MTLIADSHVLKWYAEDASLVSPRAILRLEDLDETIFVSAASLWELSIKANKGKMIIKGGVEQLVETAVRAGWQILPIMSYEAILAGALPYHHTDPFDRLIVAQALTYNFRLVSIDAVLDAYGVDRIW